MYFSSAEDWGNVGHKDNIVIVSLFNTKLCAALLKSLEFWGLS